MTPIIDDYVGKYYQKKEQSIDNQQKGLFAPLFSLHVFILSKRTLRIFLSTKRYSVSKNNEKKMTVG